MLNQLRLQQYTTLTVYVSPKSYLHFVVFVVFIAVVAVDVDFAAVVWVVVIDLRLVCIVTAPRSRDQ